MNLPDTLNFELAEADAARLSSEAEAPTRNRQNLPKPNLLESLSKNTTSSPPTALTSPTHEFSPGHSNRRDFFTSVANALAGVDPDETRPQVRKKLTQPVSRATSSPPPKPLDIPSTSYGPGASPPRARNRRVTVTDKMFADATWTVETQQFGVNGGLINAVKSAHNSGALQDYKWIGTLGMVHSLLNVC